jgi:A/G-specific adenine glycosylase
MPASTLHSPVLNWYGDHARDLPWRRPGTTAWAVLVSEVMLAQTPVSRVLPSYLAWLRRWPTAGALGAESPGEAVRMWGRLGYPRRALRLHAAARVIVARHDGEVPASYDALLALPGVGTYTAAAVASFAYGGRHAVLDTNVRRVLARCVGGKEAPPQHPTVAERALALSLVPDDAPVAARWAVAVMELGALVCTARDPRCAECPVSVQCRWRGAGKPSYDGQRRAPQGFAGTDRQVRGLIMAVLRGSADPVPVRSLHAVWSGDEQRTRALAGLVADGLAVLLPDGTVALPS